MKTVDNLTELDKTRAAEIGISEINYIIYYNNLEQHYPEGAEYYLKNNNPKLVG